MTQSNRTTDIPMPAMLGDRIREARRRLGITQGELARNDYSVSYVSAIERSKIRPSLRALAWLASRLNVNLSDLVANDSPLYGDTSETEEVQTALAHARIALTNRQFAEARATLQSAYPKAQVLSQRVHVNLLLAEALIGLGDGQGAREAAEQAQALTSDLDPTLQERSRNVLGQACYALGLYMLAQELHRQCLAAIDNQTIRDPSLELSVLYNLGNDLLQMNQQVETLEIFKRADDLGKKLRTPQLTARLYLEISSELRKEGQFSLAHLYEDLAMEHLHSAASRTILVHIQSSLALALAEKGDHKAAEEDIRHAVDLAERNGDPQALSVALSSLSRFQLGRDKVTEALQAAQRALSEAKKSKENETLGRAYLALAEAQVASDDGNHAEDSFKHGVDHLVKARSQADLVRAYERYADLQAKSGKVTEAYQNLKLARAIIGAR